MTQDRTHDDRHNRDTWDANLWPVNMTTDDEFEAVACELLDMFGIPDEEE